MHERDRHTHTHTHTQRTQTDTQTQTPRDVIASLAKLCSNEKGSRFLTHSHSVYRKLIP